MEDDASKYVWLRPCKTADAMAVYECLLEWFAAFGYCYTWVTDQGSHFKNTVIASLQHTLGAHHHFTTAHCPWANGTVEVVNRSVLRVFRALLSEWRMKSEDWVQLTPVVQLVLNHTKRKSLAGEAPIACMTGLPALSPLEPIAKGLKEVEEGTTSIEELSKMKRVNLEELVQALETLHKRANVSARADRRRGKTKTKIPNFDVGDFVLRAAVEGEPRAKLQVRWKGPSRIVRVLSQYVYEVEDLITKRVTDVHASRLKFFRDGSLEVTENLLKQVAHSQEGHEVESFGSVRYNEKQKRYEIEVKWRGLDPLENSWEPAQNLVEDVPVMLKTYLKSKKQDAMIQNLIESLH